MGHVFVHVKLAGLKAAERVRMLVDTGATLTRISSDLAQRRSASGILVAVSA